MGWLGWTEKEALSCDINSAILAVECKGDLLRSQAGVVEKDEDETVVSADKFKAYAERHNKAVGANDG